MTSVRLRPIETEDVSRVASLLAHPDLAGRRGLPGNLEGPRSVRAITSAIEELIDPECGVSWVVDVDGSVVGFATADWWWDALTPWAHVVIDPAHRRHGHGSVATLGVLDHLFSETVAHLTSYSVPSWDADGLSFADSIGGFRVGARRRVGMRRGRFYDEVGFVMTRRAWEERRGSRR
jgi:RimJ/RimL family protein N-acetyltransferase